HPRPIVDLAGLNPRSMSEVITLIFEGNLAARPLLVYSHGALCHDGFATPRALSHDNLVALRACGGVIALTPGPPWHRTPIEFRLAFEAAAALAFEGRIGFEGLAVGTDFLGIEETLPPLRSATQLQKWLKRRFDRDTAAMLIAANGRHVLVRAAGGDDIAG